MPKGLKGFQIGNQLGLGNKYSLGRKFSHSSETRKKLSEARKNRKNYIHILTPKRIAHLKKIQKLSLKLRKKKVIKYCVDCNKKLTNSKAVNCKSCSHTGIKSPNWKGGITPLRTKIYKTFNFRQWRSDVFTRDNWTCVWCGQRGGKLHVDHIEPFSFILRENKIFSVEEAINCEELWNINNGRTLCIKCHLKTNTYGGKANNYARNI